VAGLLEVIEALLTLDTPPKRSLLFALWDGEEKGLLGSTYWTQHPTVPLERLSLAINADMIGRMRGDKVSVFGTRTSRGLRRLASQNNRTTDLLLEFNWEMKANSDHHPFFAKGVPVLMLHTGLHDDYHRPSDDADKINHEGASQASRFLFSMLVEVANRPEPLAFRNQCRYEGPSDQKLLEQPVPPRPPRLGIAWKQGEGDCPGVFLTRIESGSTAEHADLRVGDCVVSFAGREIAMDEQLQSAMLAAHSPTAIVVQRGSRETLQVVVELSGEPLRLGVSWRPDDAEPGTALLSEVIPGSVADRAGLKPGDRIYQVAGRDFQNGDELRQLASTLPGPLELLVERNGRLRTVPVEIPSAE
jgi:membrane-associated protease RseP (regulator of RpoE activity)